MSFEKNVALASRMENLFPMNSNCCYIQPWAPARICMLLHFNLDDSHSSRAFGRDVGADWQQHWGWACLWFWCWLSLPHLLLAVCYTSGFSRSRNVSWLFVFVCRDLLWHRPPLHSIPTPKSTKNLKQSRWFSLLPGSLLPHDNILSKIHDTGIL